MEEHFYTDADSSLSLTTNQMFRLAFPNEYKSLRRRIIPPDQFVKLGYSSRYKIMRAVQLHYNRPPIDEPARQLTPLFKHFENHSAGHQWTLSQYNCIRWALNYSDDDLASSALLRFGSITWSSTGPPLEAPSIHSISIERTGISVRFNDDQTLQERMDAACTTVREHYCMDVAKGRTRPISDYFKIGCMAFYTYNKTFVSLYPEHNQSIKARLQVYIDDLTHRGTNYADIFALPFCTVEEAEFRVPSDDNFFLAWEDFVFEDISDRKREQLNDLARKKCLEGLIQKLSPLNLDPYRTYSRPELLQWLSSHQITSANKHGFITKGEKRGQHILTFLQTDDDDSEPKEVDKCHSIVED